MEMVQFRNTQAIKCLPLLGILKTNNIYDCSTRTKLLIFYHVPRKFTFAYMCMYSMHVHTCRCMAFTVISWGFILYTVHIMLVCGHFIFLSTAFVGEKLHVHDMH